MHTKLLSENLKGRYYSEDVGIDWKIIILEWLLGTQGGKMWSGFIWLRIGNSGGLL
jgi:hypothetical protein